MTNREKAESCGEFVRDGLDALLDESNPLSWGPAERAGLFVEPFIVGCDRLAESARQAGHWGRLALAEADESPTIVDTLWLGFGPR